MDAELSGLLVGMTLDTRPEEIYRALIEGGAFGTRENQQPLPCSLSGHGQAVSRPAEHMVLVYSRSDSSLSISASRNSLLRRATPLSPR